MNFRRLNRTNHIRVLHPRQTVLCTSKLGDKTNIITLAWTMIVSRNPPIIAISVAPQRFSHNLIKESGEFTINIPTKEIISQVHYCGSHSGKDEDKFKATNLTPIEGINVSCPRIGECIVHVECKVIESKKYGDHTLFIGEVITCLAKPDILSGNETDIEKIEIPYHIGGKKFVFNKKEVYRV